MDVRIGITHTPKELEVEMPDDSDRDKVVAESKGEADRFTKIYQQYKLAPDVTRKRMFLETMERVLSDTDKVIVDEKAGSGVVPYLPLSEFTKKAPQPPGEESQP